jgi:hypothetical protein
MGGGGGGYSPPCSTPCVCVCVCGHGTPFQALHRYLSIAPLIGGLGHGLIQTDVCFEAANLSVLRAPMARQLRGSI